MYVWEDSHTAQNGYDSVCLRSPDTDAAVIGVLLANKIQAKLIFRTGTQHHSRFIDLYAIADKQGNIAPSLIGLHSFTGCGTWSAFTGKGKKRGLVLMKEARHRQLMTDLGQSFHVTP